MSAPVKSLLMFLFSGFLFFSCSRSVAPSGSSSGQGTVAGRTGIPGPPCIVYKTKSDFNQYVPVILSEDKTDISSYPDIRDVFYNGRLALPTGLAEGYLLDNRGIGPDVAFLNISYDAYSKLPKTPGVDELMKSILEKDPLLEMYQCGLRSQYADPVDAMNNLIKSGKIMECKRLR